MLQFITILFTSCLAIQSATAHREHKVHNIVLYPDKHSWCNTTPIKQVVTFPGCHSVEIDNNVCVGACFSYSIPHTEPSDPGEVIVPYCDSCQPSETLWHNVTLVCNNTGEAQKTMLKRVQIITNCSCSPCESTKNRQLSGVSAIGSSFPEDKDNKDGGSEDVPDILDVMATNKSGTHQHNMTKPVSDVKFLLNTKIVSLLQGIQERNSNYDKSQLRELLRLVEGPEKKLSDQTIADFVESVHDSEHIELDVSRLNEVLTKFEHTQALSEKHRHYGLGHQQKDDADEHLNNEGHHGHGKHSHGSHHGHKHHSHNHHSEDLNEEGVANLDNMDDHPVHHHHIDEAIGLGHIGVPEMQIHEKLNVAPHELKANHEGTVVSYDGHARDSTKPLNGN